MATSSSRPPDREAQAPCVNHCDKETLYLLDFDEEGIGSDSAGGAGGGGGGGEKEGADGEAEQDKQVSIHQQEHRSIS